MTRPITVGVDGSPESLAAVAWAAGRRSAASCRCVWCMPGRASDAGEHGRRRRGTRWRRPRAVVAERHPGPPGDHRRPGRGPGRLAGRRGRGRRDAGARLARARSDRRLPARLRRPAGDRRVRAPRRPRTRRRTAPNRRRPAARSSWDSRAARTTAPPPWGSPSRPRRHAAPPYVSYGPGACRRLRVQPRLAEAPRRGRRPGTVREEGPRRGAAALAGALPRGARDRARRDGQRGRGAAVGGRRGPS